MSKTIALLSSSLYFHRDTWCIELNLWSKQRNGDYIFEPVDFPYDTKWDWLLDRYDGYMLIGCWRGELEFLYKLMRQEQQSVFNKKGIIVFIGGTDVGFWNENIFREEDWRYGRLDPQHKAHLIEYLNTRPNTLVVADGVNIVKGLKEVGFKRVLDVPCPSIHPEPVISPFPAQPTVSCYISTNPLFFNFPIVLDLAYMMPNIKFNIFGGYDFISILPNVVNWGYVSGEKWSKLCGETMIFLRIPQHDARSVSLIEFLKRGARAIWINDYLPYVYSLPKGWKVDDVARLIQKLVEFKNPDYRSAFYYQRHYSNEIIRNKMGSLVVEVLGC